jgi:prepilin-type N-terminal cleavage/methylation domain-containing protein
MHRRSGFSLIELLTVISITVLLIGITVPALSRARIYARSLISARNQRDIVTAVTLSACEHDQQFPSSVALCERPDRRSWRWQDPRKLRTTEPLQRMEHSSVAAYLRHYLEDSTRLACPSIPQPYPYWREAWEAGDNWDHPETEKKQDAVFGSYCLYWNYVGCQDNGPFRGPRTLYGGRGESKVLVSDYFGYDEARSPGLYGSCELSSAADINAVEIDKLDSTVWLYDFPPRPPQRT